MIRLSCPNAINIRIQHGRSEQDTQYYVTEKPYRAHKQGNFAMYNMVVYKSSVYDSNAERYQRKDEMRRIKNEIHANRKEKLDGKYKSKREEKKRV